MIKSIRGVIFAFLLFAISAALVLKGAGAFDRSPKVYVNVPAEVNVEVDGEMEAREPGLLLGSDNSVRYEGIIVGRVANIETGLTDEQGERYSRLELQVDSDVIADMPTDTLARIVPRTLFGDNEVHLVAPYEEVAAERDGHAARR
jgi:phospholipid/cholesterol/gamma-HCH transport system substrate-binding protein